MSDEISYTSIRVSTLRGDLEIPFDVYVKVGDHFVHYCRKGTSFAGDRLDRLKSKKITNMYIRPEEQLAYRQYLDASLAAAYSNNPPKPLEIRAQVIQGFQQAAAEECMETPDNQSVYEYVRTSLHQFVNFLDGEKEGAGALLRLVNTDQSITHHSVNVATLSAAMVMRAGAKAGTPLHLLGLGCLLHDIDHFYSRLSVSRPVKDLSPEEAQHYKSHPLDGARRFQKSLFVDQLVLNIISQHEETMDGTGFPKGLRADDMDPLVMIAATANAYDRLVSFEGMEPKRALKSMLIDKVGVYPLPVLQTLQELLKEQKLL